jgi:ABC-type glycerol-3-phosphate transport system substrate-binding protein
MKKKGLLLASVLATAIMLASCGQTTSVTVTSSEGGVSESLESSETSEYVAPSLATGAQSYVGADYVQ